MKTPERTTAEVFPRYLGGEVLADSATLKWSGLFARRYRFPRVVDGFLVPGDVSKAAEAKGIIEAAIKNYGRLDILVNNAAVATLVSVADATETQVDTVLNVNVKGTVFGCQLAAQHLADGGRIINISSSTTGLALPGYGIYDMTKGAIEQLTRILAHELGARRITVNAVSPGATETDTYRVGKAPAFVASLERMSVFNRLGTIEEIADVIAFVASDNARWITGQNIRVNGGTV